MIARLSRWYSAATVPVVVLALALPVLLVHPDHVPVLASSAGIDVRMSDLAIALVVILAIASDRDAGSRRAARRWLWLAPFFVLLLGSAVAVPDTGKVTVALLKLLEYAGLGVAITMLLRDRRSQRAFIVSLVISSATIALVGAAELLREGINGVRAESVIGSDPLGLLGAALLVISLAGRDLIGSRVGRLATAAVGLLCFVEAGSMSAALGLFMAVGFAAIRRLGPFARLRTASLVAFAVAAIAIGGGLAATRSSDIRAAVNQLTSSPAEPRPGGSFTQRAMFADFGLRMWFDHPVLGVGFQQSPRLEEWAPYLASVRADFPGLPEYYFPAVPGISFGQPRSATTSPTGFGVHNVYSQLLAETGVVGLVLFSVGFVGIAGGAFRRARHSEAALIGSLLVLVVLGGFTRNELYGGLPETTLLAIALAFGARGGSSSTARGLGESRRVRRAVPAWSTQEGGLHRGLTPQSSLATYWG